MLVDLSVLAKESFIVNKVCMQCNFETMNFKCHYRTNILYLHGSIRRCLEVLCDSVSWQTCRVPKAEPKSADGRCCTQRLDSNGSPTNQQ